MPIFKHGNTIIEYPIHILEGNTKENPERDFATLKVNGHDIEFYDLVVFYDNVLNKRLNLDFYCTTEPSLNKILGLE